MKETHKKKTIDTEWQYLGFAYGKTETWIKGFFWNREWFTISAWWNQFKEVLIWDR